MKVRWGFFVCCIFLLFFLFFYPCPPFSAVSVSRSFRVEWINCDPACLPCIKRCIRGFSGQGLQWSSFRVPCGFPDQKVFTQPRLQRARASGWSRTVTNRLLWRLSQQDLSWDPDSSTILPHCNRFRLILCLFVILCIMQLLKLPGLCSEEREWEWWNRKHFQSSQLLFALSCLAEISAVYSTVCEYLQSDTFSVVWLCTPAHWILNYTVQWLSR